MTVLIAVETVVLIVLAVLVAGLLRAYATVLSGCMPWTAVEPRRRPLGTAAGVPAPPSGSGPAATAAASGSGDAAGGRSGRRPATSAARGRPVRSSRFAPSRSNTTRCWSSCPPAARDARCSGNSSETATGRSPARTGCGPEAGLVVTRVSARRERRPFAAAEPTGRGCGDVDACLGRLRRPRFAVRHRGGRAVRAGQGRGSGTSLDQISGLMQQAYGDGAGGPREPRGSANRCSDMEREVDVDRALLAAGNRPRPSPACTTPPDEDAASDLTCRSTCPGYRPSDGCRRSRPGPMERRRSHGPGARG